MGNTASHDTEEYQKPVAPLTDQEIGYVKDCWDEIASKQDLGMAIMIRLFTAHSEIKHKWIFAANLETEAEMVNNSQIIYHSKKIIEVFGKILNVVFTKGSFKGMELERLGRSHFHYGVVPSDFKHFEESLVYALKKSLPNKNLTQKIVKAWHRVFVHLIVFVLDGLKAEEVEDSKEKTSESIQRVSLS